MPIYEYRCSECGEKFEKLVRLSTSTSEIECPKCGGQKVDKLISVFSPRTSSSAAASVSACAPASSG
jgi:putative FmdB family regulatory protein